MIRIKPYYERPKKDRHEILELYLNMVADVVPFLTEDIVLVDDGVIYTTTKKRPQRQRRGAYKNLIETYVEKGITGKVQDALLARALIKEYSEDLYNYLYTDPEDKSGHVNKENLGALLTIKLPGDGHEKILNFKPNPVTEKEAKAQLTAEGKEENVENIKKAKEAINKSRREKIQKHVFRYDSFSDHPKVYALIEKLGVNVCPYCNRQYITIVSNLEEETGEKPRKSPPPEDASDNAEQNSQDEEKNKRTRPQLDHYKSKKHFPWLALSINNLVPSCGVCNLLKHDDEEDVLYPYSEDMASLYKFSTENNDGKITSLLTGAKRASKDFKIVLKRKPEAKEGDPAVRRADNSIKSFLLNKVYQSHKEYITAMYFQRYVNTDELLRDRIDQFPELFRPEGDTSDRPLTTAEKNAALELLKRTIFLMDYRQEAWDRRPLAKLTHDISKEIEELYAKRAELLEEVIPDI